jgi:acetyltransferase-like isoleucine patch superfamily enzyme
MKSEKEKMLSGGPYNAFDKELEEERLKARILIHEYNLLTPEETSRREEIIQSLMGATGANFYLEAPFHCDYGYNIHLGENFFSNYNLTILDCAKVSIGKNVLIGPHVGIYTAGHPVHPETRNSGLEYALPISIGDNVWIGGHVVINPGVTIGDGVVIGSGSVVTRDLPSNVIAMGNPCKVLREITDEDRNHYYKNQNFDES